MAGKSRRLAGNLALAGGALLGGLLICELVLRLIFIGYPVYIWTDPIRGIAHIPGARSLHQYNGRWWIEINSDGLRGPEVSLQRPAGTYRIALLGDSFIEAFEVPYEKTAGEVLERRLSSLRGTPVEVLNFGVGGYGTAQELLTLRHQVCKYSPDLVLLAVTTGNDISDNYRPMNRGGYRPYFVLQGSELVLDSSFLQSSEYRSRAVGTRRLLGVVRHSRVAQLLNRVRHVRRESAVRREDAKAPGEEVGLRDLVHVPPTTPDWQEAWRVTEAIIRQMRDECRTKGVQFALVTLTRGIQVSPLPEQKKEFLRQIGAEDLFYPERRLAELGEREGFAVLNLAPIMAKQAEERHVYYHADGNQLGVGHWNEEGNRAAGELIATWLASGLAGRKLADSQP